MKICFISREYPPETHIGGIGTYTYNMATALTNLGHTVHVIASTKNSEQAIQDNGVWVHRLKNQKILPKELSYLYYSYLVAKKVTQIPCELDIVQASEFAGEALLFAFKKKLPLITRLATPLYLSDKIDGMAFFRLRPMLYLMEKKQTLFSNGIFTSTRALANEVTEKWGIKPCRVEIIPNSVNISRIKRLGENMSAPKILKNKEFLLYFGRLEERKGVRILAQALPAVFERFPALSMLFIGSDCGHRRSSMRQYIRKRSGKYQKQVLFFDNLSHEKLFPIVNLAKLVILPSLWEAFGFVCVEAMALGRPVIATSGSGFEEIIEDNVSGYLVPPGDSQLLSEKIIWSLKSGENMARISEGARKRAGEFEVSKIAVELIAYYERIRKKIKTRSDSNDLKHSFQ